jgi:hypothetical protein
MLSVAIFLSVLGSASAEWYCDNVTVLHKVTRGPGSWYDGCLGLTHKSDFDSAGIEGCKQQCYKDMNCSVWQVVKAGDESKCWSGSAVHACRSRGSADAAAAFQDDLLGGERIQHGFIKATPKTDVQVLGLRSYPEDTGDKATKVQRCREFCETTVSCTVWQFLETTDQGDGVYGCWLEHAPDHLQTGFDRANGTDVIVDEGETIEHTCPPYVKPDELPWPWIIAGCVLGLLALVGIIYALTKKTPKVKKTRAVKIEQKPEVPEQWQELSYLVQAPNGQLFQQRSLVKVNDQILAAEQAGQTQPLLNR